MQRPLAEDDAVGVGVPLRPVLACVTWRVGSVWARRGLPRALGGGALLSWVFLVLAGSLVAFSAYMVLLLIRPRP